jgi:hypothetical protein
MNGLRITLAAGVAAALACTSLEARADEESGLAIGARIAGGIPFGDAQHTVNADGTTTSTSMAKFQRASLPVWFDLGYRFSPRVYVGLYYAYAVTFPPTGENGNTGCYVPPTSQLKPAVGMITCDGFDQRFGVNLHYHFLPKEFTDPWIGVGVGAEMSQLNYAQEAATATGSFQVWGWSADLQLGADLRFSKVLPVGPFLDLSVSQFGTENTYDQNNHGSSLAFNATLHGWLLLGLRAQFNL